jgi:phosphoglucosamine mutase
MVDCSFADQLAPAAQLGKALRMEDASGRYIEYVKSSFPKGLTLDGLKIVVDCANGAAYKVAPRVLAELGAEVVPIAVEPNGRNINDNCGAVSPQVMQEAVVLHNADIGIALDGDADRLIVADERGVILDGDQLMALIATNMAHGDRLQGGALVATIMSNLGLEHRLAKQGIGLHRTAVGDRYVVEKMRSLGCNLGGEQSGHIILSDYATTGDGLIAALQVLAAIVQTGKHASEVCRVFEPVPQLLRNVRFGHGRPLETARVKRAIAAAEARLGKEGRLVIRNSGTEPVIRVMAQGEDESLLTGIVDDICATILSVAQGTEEIKSPVRAAE